MLFHYELTSCESETHGEHLPETYLNHASLEADVARDALEDSPGGVGVQAVALVQNLQLLRCDGGPLPLVPPLVVLHLSPTSLALTAHVVQYL